MDLVCHHPGEGWYVERAPDGRALLTMIAGGKRRSATWEIDAGELAARIAEADAAMAAVRAREADEAARRAAETAAETARDARLIAALIAAVPMPVAVAAKIASSHGHWLEAGADGAVIADGWRPVPPAKIAALAVQAARDLGIDPAVAA